MIIIIFITGLVSGIYICSQLEKSIEKNIEHPDNIAIREIDKTIEKINNEIQN